MSTFVGVSGILSVGEGWYVGRVHTRISGGPALHTEVDPPYVQLLECRRGTGPPPPGQRLPRGSRCPATHRRGLLPGGHRDSAVAGAPSRPRPAASGLPTLGPGA